MIEEDDKVELSRKRAELVESLATPLALEERVRVQGELSVINARIKALNTTAAARLKAAADRKKVAGMAEAQANAARARAKIGGGDAPDDTDNGPAQASAIDAWITTVLADSGVKVRRSRDGLDFGDVPAKWLMVLQRMRAGIHAVARGEELPDTEAENGFVGSYLTATGYEENSFVHSPEKRAEILAQVRPPPAKTPKTKKR